MFVGACEECDRADVELFDYGSLFLCRPCVLRGEAEEDWFVVGRTATGAEAFLVGGVDDRTTSPDASAARPLSMAVARSEAEAMDRARLGGHRWKAVPESLLSESR